MRVDPLSGRCPIMVQRTVQAVFYTGCVCVFFALMGAVETLAQHIGR